MKTCAVTNFPWRATGFFSPMPVSAPCPAEWPKPFANMSRSAPRATRKTLLPAPQMQHSRQLAARLLNAQPDEIAFVGPTSLALSLVAAGLPWKKHDRVLIYFDDYPANVYPWMALAERGSRSAFWTHARRAGLVRCRGWSGGRTDAPGGAGLLPFPVRPTPSIGTRSAGRCTSATFFSASMPSWAPFP